MNTPPPDEGHDGSVDHPLDDELLDDELLADQLDYGLDASDDDGPQWGLIIGVFVALAAIGFLVFDGLQNETYFFDVHDAVERGDELAGQTIRIRGEVVPGTHIGEDGQLRNQFDLTTDGESLTVVYERALPDTFEEDSEVVAQGTLNDDFVLYADEVLVKCPSRYEGAPPESGGDYEYDSEGDYDYDDAFPEDTADPTAQR